MKRQTVTAGRQRGADIGPHRAGMGSGSTADRQRGCGQPAVQKHLGCGNTTRQGLLSVTQAHLLLPLLLKPDIPAARIEPERLSYLPLAAAELQRTYHMQARARGGRSRSSSSSRCVREAPAAPTTPRNSPESQHTVCQAGGRQSLAALACWHARQAGAPCTAQGALPGSGKPRLTFLRGFPHCTEPEWASQDCGTPWAPQSCSQAQAHSLGPPAQGTVQQTARCQCREPA